MYLDKPNEDQPLFDHKGVERKKGPLLNLSTIYSWVKLYLQDVHHTLEIGEGNVIVMITNFQRARSRKLRWDKIVGIVIGHWIADKIEHGRRGNKRWYTQSRKSEGERHQPPEMVILIPKA